MRRLFVGLVLCCLCFVSFAQTADPATYLNDVKSELRKKWPDNRAVFLVFHGHSVPSGYFNTPNVRTLDSYPQQVLRAVKGQYPYAVMNSLTTAIGGENSVQGAKRFAREVLVHRPDVLFIDYALNDRGVGLEVARKAWTQMIKLALKRSIKVVLCTPSPDLSVDILDSTTTLAQHAAQIRELAAEFSVGLADSYAAFEALKKEGANLKDYMSQSNHPNESGHGVICRQIEKWFK